MSWAARTLALAITLTSAACSSDPVEVQRDDDVPRPAFAAAPTCSEASGRFLANFTDYWSCGQTIRINLTALPSTLIGDARAAMADWNNALSAQQYGLPFLSESSGSPIIRVNLASTGSLYCGQVLPAPPSTPTTINMSSGSCGTFHDVFLHELSHVYGFKDAWEKSGIVGFSDHCARHLPNGKATNEAVCRHEVESLHWKYQIRAAGQVSTGKHIMTGLSGLTSRTISLGSTTTLTVTGLGFERGQCTGGSGLRMASLSRMASSTAAPCPGPTGMSFTWTPSSTTIISLSGQDPSRTVRGDNPGTATVTVRPSTTAYEIAGDFKGNAPTITVQAVPPAGRPTSLTATGITATSATINWTNGDTSPGTTTFLQYRITGQSAWSNTNGGVGFPAGQSSYLLTGLQCGTSYDLNIWHQKNGINSQALTLTVFSTAACQAAGLNPPSAFRANSCTPTTSGGKPYATYNVSWTAGANPSSSLFHIVESSSNNPAAGTVIRSGPISTVTAKLGPYLVTTGASPRYFWVRHVNGSQSSAWVAIEGNPIQIKYGCAL